MTTKLCFISVALIVCLAICSTSGQSLPNHPRNKRSSDDWTWETKQPRGYEFSNWGQEQSSIFPEGALNSAQTLVDDILEEKRHTEINKRDMDWLVGNGDQKPEETVKFVVYNRDSDDGPVPMRSSPLPMVLEVEPSADSREKSSLVQDCVNGRGKCSSQLDSLVGLASFLANLAPTPKLQPKLQPEPQPKPQPEPQPDNLWKIQEVKYISDNSGAQSLFSADFSNFGDYSMFSMSSDPFGRSEITSLSLEKPSTVPDLSGIVDGHEDEDAIDGPSEPNDILSKVFSDMESVSSVQKPSHLNFQQLPILSPEFYENLVQLRRAEEQQQGLVRNGENSFYEEKNYPKTKQLFSSPSLLSFGFKKKK